MPFPFTPMVFGGFRGAVEQKLCSRERYQIQTFFAPDDRALRFGALKRLARGIVQRVSTENLRKMGGGVA